MRVGIIGGGISGLCTAISLHAVGIDCQLFDSSPTPKTLGVGINLLPHAVQALDELEIYDALKSLAIEPKHLLYCDRWGNRIWQEHLGEHAGLASPQVSIQRERLLSTLWDAATKRLGPNSILSGMSLVNFEQLETNVSLQLSNVASNSITTQEFDVLVAADGINSAVRKSFYPKEQGPTISGISMFRGVAKSNPILDGSTIVVAGDMPGMKFVAYPLTTSDSQFEQEINWVLEIASSQGESSDLPIQKQVPIADVLEHLGPWQIPFLDIRKLIESSHLIVRNPMVDRPPVSRWSFDRVTLLGDAAHPMFPMGMNGGSQSILDGVVLAKHLAKKCDPCEALKDYERERLEPLNKIVLANRSCGPEEIMVLAHKLAPTGFVDIKDVISIEKLEEIVNTYKALTTTNKSNLFD